MATGARKASVYLWSVIRTFLCFSAELKELTGLLSCKSTCAAFFFFSLSPLAGSTRSFEWRKTRRSDRWQPHLHFGRDESTIGALPLTHLPDLTLPLKQHKATSPPRGCESTHTANKGCKKKKKKWKDGYDLCSIVGSRGAHGF